MKHIFSHVSFVRRLLTKKTRAKVKIRAKAKAKAELLIPYAFPDWHPKAGKATYFASKILADKQSHKIHQIVFYDDNWTQVSRRVNRGELTLDIVYRHIDNFNISDAIIKKQNVMGVQSGHFMPNPDDGVWVNNRVVPIAEIADNEGLCSEDFKQWYDGEHCRDFFLIQITDFKY